MYSVRLDGPRRVMPQDSILSLDEKARIIGLQRAEGHRWCGIFLELDYVENQIRDTLNSARHPDERVRLAVKKRRLYGNELSDEDYGEILEMTTQTGVPRERLRLPTLDWDNPAYRADDRASAHGLTRLAAHIITPKSVVSQKSAATKALKACDKYAQAQA